MYMNVHSLKIWMEIKSLQKKALIILITDGASCSTFYSRTSEPGPGDIYTLFCRLDSILIL